VIVTPGSVARLGVLILLAVVFQVSALAGVRIGGGSIDLVPLVVGGAALLMGSVPGAISGFAAGLLLDLALGHTLGASSLVLTAVGYGVGRYREVRDPSNGLTPIPVSAAATAGYVVGVAGVSFMLDFGASVSPLVLREMLATVALNAIVALPVFAALQRVMRPALAADPFVSRRRPREATSGPLGLRGLEV